MADYAAYQHLDQSKARSTRTRLLYERYDFCSLPHEYIRFSGTFISIEVLKALIRLFDMIRQPRSAMVNNDTHGLRNSKGRVGCGETDYFA